MEPLKKPCFQCGAPRYQRSTKYCAVCDSELWPVAPNQSKAAAPFAAYSPNANVPAGQRPAKNGGCATCARWGGWMVNKYIIAPYGRCMGAAICTREREPRFNNTPEQGCEHWLREAGADDQPFDWKWMER